MIPSIDRPLVVVSTTRGERLAKCISTAPPLGGEFRVRVRFWENDTRAWGGELVEVSTRIVTREASHADVADFTKSIASIADVLEAAIAPRAVRHG